MFENYDCFRLTKALEDESVPLGTLGVVLMVFHKNPVAYEVEFPDDHGVNKGASMTYTITEDFMEPI